MKKILVIEDESCTRDLFLQCLSAEGFSAIGAEDGYAGVEQAKKQSPDLVICDVVMPSLDGLDVLNILRQNPPTAMIPFLFITASITKAELLQNQDLGIDNYLLKPATVDDLLEAVSNQLTKHTQSPHSDPELTPAIEPSEDDFQSIFPSVPQLEEVFKFIEANYQQPISLNDVAQAVGYSPAYLTSLVGNRTGRTVSRWIVERRMAEARSLLRQSDWSVDYISRAVGYTNVRHFFRQFRQHHKVTPQDWRKQQQVCSVD